MEHDLKGFVNSNNLVVVAGTGVSIMACNRQKVDGHEVASWTGLLRHGVEYCRDVEQALDADEIAIVEKQISSGKTQQLIQAAETIVEALMRKDAGTYRRWLRKSVGELAPSSPEILDALKYLGGVLVTLNYDPLLVKRLGYRWVTWLERDRDRLGRVLRGEEDRTVVHLHGYYEEPDSVVLGIRSYERVKSDPHTETVMRLFNLDRNLLFVGCRDTVSDPNFGNLIQWGHEALKDSTHRHYLLCRESELYSVREMLRDNGVNWLYAVPYGNEYADLVPFLRSIVAPGEVESVGEAQSDHILEGSDEKAPASSVSEHRRDVEENATDNSNSNKTVTQERRIDAAVPDEACIGDELRVFVQARFPSSPPLDASIWPGGVRPTSLSQDGREIITTFHRDPLTGEILDAECRIRLVAPGCKIHGSSEKTLIIPEKEESELISFIIEPNKIGLCQIDLEILNRNGEVLKSVPMSTAVKDCMRVGDDALGGGGKVVSLTLSINVVDGRIDIMGDRARAVMAVALQQIVELAHSGKEPYASLLNSLLGEEMITGKSQATSVQKLEELLLEKLTDVLASLAKWLEDNGRGDEIVKLREVVDVFVAVGLEPDWVEKTKLKLDPKVIEKEGIHFHVSEWTNSHLAEAILSAIYEAPASWAPDRDLSGDFAEIDPPSTVRKSDVEQVRRNIAARVFGNLGLLGLPSDATGQKLIDALKEQMVDDHEPNFILYVKKNAWLLGLMSADPTLWQYILRMEAAPGCNNVSENVAVVKLLKRLKEIFIKLNELSEKKDAK